MTISASESLCLQTRQAFFGVQHSILRYKQLQESQFLFGYVHREDYERDTNQRDLTQRWYPLKHPGISYQDVISFDKELDVEWARDGKSFCDLSGRVLHLDQKDNDITLKNILWLKNKRKNYSTLNLDSLNFSL